MPATPEVNLALALLSWSTAGFCMGVAMICAWRRAWLFAATFGATCGFQAMLGLYALAMALRA